MNRSPHRAHLAVGYREVLSHFINHCLRCIQLTRLHDGQAATDGMKRRRR